MKILNYLPRSSTHVHLFLLLLLILSSSLLQHASAQQPPDSSSSSSSQDNDTPLDSTGVNPSLAVVIIVVVVVFFMAATFSFYIHNCSEDSPSSSTTSAASTSVPTSKKGIEKSVIETFPTFLYSEVRELKYGKESLECAVCLNEFEEDENLRLLPKCDHVFHSECIDAWLDGHVTCPVCRANLLPNLNNNKNSQCESRSYNGENEVPSGEVRIDVLQGENGGEAKETVKLNKKLQRSHSTGHSLSQPREDLGRFTLKLPAEARRQLLARSKLKRATSQLALPRASSSRRGYRGGGEGSGSSRYGGVFGRSMSRVVSFKWMPTKVREGLPSSLPV